MFTRLFAPLHARSLDVSAHCDLPCGVYDPAQARIEAESVKKIIEKVNASDDADL
ncbi:MAG: superoxide dismutase [Ni], partial [Ornithinimicrobium sp.]